MTARGFALAAMVFGVAALCGPAPVVAGEAGAFIRTTGEKALNSLTDTKLSDEVRAERFRKQLVETFDLPTIGRFVLGRYWRVASEQQRSEYLTLFEDYLVQTYSAQFKGLQGTLRVDREYPIKPRDVLVLTEVEISKGRPVRINWRVRGPRPEEFRIVDVMFEGISMSVTQRDQFAAVINRGGGKLDGLLDELRRQTRKGK